MKKELFLASTLSLFVELLLIRWIPNTFHIVAFFNNLVLIGCFLGLGIGFAKRAPVSISVRNALIGLAVLTAVIAGLDVLNPVVKLPAGSDYAVNEIQEGKGFAVPMQPLLIAVFVLSVLAMIPFGQIVATFFEQVPVLRAYSINILGSLAGVLLFSAVCWMWLPPPAWYGVVFLLLLMLDRRLLYAVPILVIFGALFVVEMRDRARPGTWLRWSPYYKVIARPIHPQWSHLEEGFTVTVNDQFLLSGLDLRADSPFLQKLPPRIASELTALRSYYEFPFLIPKFTGQAPSGDKKINKVLILGAGAGNDTAAALRLGVTDITAVELDPCVIHIGTKYHPEKPYLSHSVRLLQQDARAFLRRSREKFDLIIFATLDAHGLLSQMGNVRLDSFVYTENSFREAKELLTPSGLLVLSFGPFREDVQYRQMATLSAVFGQRPLYLEHTNGHRTIVAGPLGDVYLKDIPESWRVIGDQEIESKFRQYPYAKLFATDDWPHLYIKEKQIPREYLAVLGLIIVVSLILLAANFRRSFRWDGHFFFLGTGFLLLETKSVTEFALLVGSTWIVNAIVFSAILFTILAANLIVRKWGDVFSKSICYLLLLVGLLASYFAPISTWAEPGNFIHLVFASAFAAFPILMAGIIFATSLQSAEHALLALASNLLGAVLGGTAEYFSLSYGIRALALLAFAFYTMSFAFLVLKRRPQLNPVGV